MRSGKILGAGLDVLEYENCHLNFFKKIKPRSIPVFIEAPNVILTPHVAGWTLRVMSDWRKL
jgi:D-3-phosphoglycerate dehydrogenase